jgi:hypothetical protein
VEELNKAVHSRSLHAPERIESLQPSAEARELLAGNPDGEKAQLLNRWLLEEAYPDDLFYNHFSNTLRREKAYQDPNWELRDNDLREVESRTLDRAKYAIFLIALIGGAITLYLVRTFEVNAFNLLYITYVAQMSLFPTIWVILHGERRLQPRGAASIGLGLLAGGGAVVYGLAASSAVAAWAPTIAVGVACLIYWPFRSRPQFTRDLTA